MTTASRFTSKQDLLRQIPSIDDLMQTKIAVAWSKRHPARFVANCFRDAVNSLRKQVVEDATHELGPQHVTSEHVLYLASELIAERTQPHLRAAINATGVLLHPGLGRAVRPDCVMTSLAHDLTGPVSLAIDRRTGLPSQRDGCVEYILRELTGAEAATVVNNGAAAVLLALTALAEGKEVLVSRGELIQTTDGFSLPEMVSRSGAKLQEVGTTNSTSLEDYAKAISSDSAAVLRCHPGDFRTEGFCERTHLKDLANLAHSHWLTVVDDLGSGSLVNLAPFGLPDEPTVADSIAQGADLVLFSTDELIGAGQGGVIAGRHQLVDRIRKHPLARALQPGKDCLMALERTLHLFRDQQDLVRAHPLYVALSATKEMLQKRALDLVAALQAVAPRADVQVAEAPGHLRSERLDVHSLPTYRVAIALSGIEASELACRLRMDETCLFTRVMGDYVVIDVRTLTNEEIPLIAEAMQRAQE
jgi:L-seryl-tRNA(Ser) seleniumtransferase